MIILIFFMGARGLDAERPLTYVVKSAENDDWARPLPCLMQCL